MKKEQQDAVLDFIRSAATGLTACETTNQADNYPNSPANISIDKEVDAYRKMLELKKKAADGLSSSNGQNITTTTQNKREA